MPGYIAKVLRRFQHIKKKRQHTPHECAKPFYGKKTQYIPPSDHSKKLDPKGIIRVQSIAWTFTYYARAVDPSILPAINEIPMVQSDPTENTNNKITMLLDYLATYSNAKIRYHASDMVLHIDSDVANLVLPNARNRIAGYIYLSKQCTGKMTKSPPINGGILVKCKVLKHVVSSAAEAETGWIFHNCQTAVMVRNILNALGHTPQLIPVKQTTPLHHHLSMAY